MTLDDQLKRAFETLSDRLRAEIERQAAAAVEELAASARAEREKAIDEAREAASRVANGALEAAVADAREQAHAAGVSGGRAEGVRQGLEEGRRQGFDEGRQHGFAEGREQGVTEGRDQGPAGSGALASAVSSIGQGCTLSEILDALVAGASHHATHADVWVLRGDTLRKWRAEGAGGELAVSDSGPIGDAVRSGAAASSGDQVAAPIVLAGQVVAVLVAGGSESAPVDTGAISVLAQFAARCLEALTAFKTARAMWGHEGGAPVQAQGAIAEEIESARRYARLLVSEIKLYHEPAVVEGRRDRDLATRLGGEIARARMLYEERVPLPVRQRADYFHEELVRTLADGDASLLQLT
jgi:hypothetical protein